MLGDLHKTQNKSYSWNKLQIARRTENLEIKQTWNNAVPA